MLNFLVLTRTYNEHDFLYWYQYHRNQFPLARFVFLDNDSPVNLLAHISRRDLVIPVHGFPDQHNLYNRVFNECNIFSDGDFVSIIDDDEYLYFHDRNDVGDLCILEDVLSRTDKDVLLVPQILMSAKELPVARYEHLPLPCTHVYRRNDVATTCKSIVRFHSGNTYDFTVNTVGGTRGHIPAVNGKIDGYSFAWWRKPGQDLDVETITFPVPNAPFAMVDYSSNIRLYHYHLKSRADWDIKVARGSCATRVPWYSNVLEENKFYGGYDTVDMDMKELYEQHA